jgi:hypothetical protein
MMISTRLKTRETIYHKQPGGDGNGNLLERIQAAVHGMSRTTRFQSKPRCKLYGVILNEQTLEVDEAAAKTLRMEMRSYPWIPIWSCHPIQTSQVVALKAAGLSPAERTTRRRGFE